LEGAKHLGIALGPEHISCFQTYYQELVSWNQKFNLTTITGYEEVQVRHFLDSLSCLLALEPPWGPTIDIGTGPGFPGLPVKIVRPELKLTLLEAIGKKARFLEHITQKLGLEGVEILQGRAEEFGKKAAYREGFQVGLARALAPLPTLVEYALPFLRLGGLLIAHKGTKVEEEVRGAQKALHILGGRLREVRDLRAFGLGGIHSLVLIEKVMPTPPNYPRRPGIPAKHPLL